MTDFNYITTIEDYKAAAETLTDEPLALDTETSVKPEYRSIGSALDCYTSEIALLILKTRAGTPLVFDLAWLRYYNYDPSLIANAIARAEYIIGANLKFDLKFLYREFGIWYKRLYDVVIGSKLIGNATGSKVARQLGHGYADICRELLNVHITGKQDLRKSSWAIGLEGRRLDSQWWLDKVTYAANDVQYLFPIMDIQRDVICTPLPHTQLIDSDNHSEHWGLGMADSLDREMRIVPVIAKMEYEGVPVSKPMMAAFQEAVKQELNRVGAYLSIEFNLDEPHVDEITGELYPTNRAMRKLRSSSGLLSLINDGLKLSKIDNTQAEGLRRAIDILETLSAMENQAEASEVFVDEEESELYSEFLDLERSALLQLTPVVKAILDYKKLMKQDGMDLRRYINPVTGRIHASYDQLGAATSRLSCQRPNLQQQSGRTKVKTRIKKGEGFNGRL